MRESGIPLRPTWVAFTPWTTLDDYRAMIDFVDREDLIDAVDPVQYSIRLLVPPGSLLATSQAMRPHLGQLVAEDFYYEWTHPDPSMDELQRAVASLVEDAAARAEDPAVTFWRIRDTAEAAAGCPPRSAPILPTGRPRAPRLSEPWFC